MRHEIELSRTIKPIVGGPYTIRTFHGPNYGTRDMRRHIDQLVTMTLPAVDGECVKIVPSVTIEL